MVCLLTSKTLQATISVSRSERERESGRVKQVIRESGRAREMEMKGGKGGQTDGKEGEEEMYP